MTLTKLAQKLINHVDELSLVPSVIVKVIIEYSAPGPWRKEMLHQWSLNAKCAALVSDGTSLYACSGGNHIVYCFNLKTNQIEDTWSLPNYNFVYPQGIEILGDEIYILDAEQMQVFSISHKNLIRRWDIIASTSCRRVFLKVDYENVYITVSRVNQIFVYNRIGILQKKYGQKVPGSGLGQFHSPHGLTVDYKYLYVCDRDNHRVQVLMKDTGAYSHYFGTKGTDDGQFILPYSILVTEGDDGQDVVYVGDESRIQIFSIEGNFKQKLLGRKNYGDEIGEFNCVSGLYIIYNHLYISDCNNNRIQIWH